MTLEPQLCSLCTKIDVNSLVPHCLPGEDDSDTAIQLCFAHHQSLDELSRSARSCALCKMMHASLVRQNATKVLPPDFTSSSRSNVWLISGGEMFYDITLPKRLSTIRVCVGHSIDFSSQDFGLFTTAEDPLARSEDVIGRLPERSTSSPKVLTLLKHWVRDCEVNHPECGAHHERTGEPDSPTTSSLPTRILKLNENGTVHLLEPGGNKGRYVALSYCWGVSQHFTTSSSTYDQLKQGVPVEILPRTLQDAVKVTLDLEIDLLWIDALCIIQDDLSDWRRESANMGDIYAGAALTIAASSASDTSIGFLKERYSKDLDVLALTSECSDASGSGTIFVYPRTGSVDQVLDRGVLNSRGWCLQERILSRRLVHFAQDQLYWECQRYSLAEDGTTFSYGHDLKRSLMKAVAEHNRERVFIEWQNTVAEFSQRNLTKASDVFPAIAGLARQISSATSCKYIAGLWYDDLHRSLLWSAVPDSSAKRQPKWRAPSWSWASMDGYISFRQVTMEKYIVERATILDAQATLKGFDEFGEISSAALRIRGKCKDVKRGSKGRIYFKREDVNEHMVFSLDGSDIGNVVLDNRKGTDADLDFKALVILDCLINNRRINYFIALTAVEGRIQQYIRIGVGAITQKNFFDDCEPQTLTLI